MTHLSQVCLVTGFIAEDGYCMLAQQVIEEAEHGLGRLLLNFDQTGQWPEYTPELLDRLTTVVNEYDRILATVRLEVIARASDHLERLKTVAARTKPSIEELSQIIAPAPSGRETGDEPAPITSRTCPEA
ncbi:hypothetical protein [Paraburkholderia sp. Ac-20347]|uniref:hypothetical protein n=1 Tax=Paraburkholderia sp. Ac-20347 TaxID=2703892 RepID=UPI00197D7E5F|nr:hypothetical protein [Paraburkholderia sp. Ac-20347]MBN3808531.1 hypothetical protein [Paraburkholderia sp. Ac-20347]